MRSFTLKHWLCTVLVFAACCASANGPDHIASMPLDDVRPILEASGKVRENGGIAVPTIMVFDSEGTLAGIHISSAEQLVDELRTGNISPLPGSAAGMTLAHFFDMFEPPPPQGLGGSSPDWTVLVMFVQGTRGLCPHCSEIIPEIREGLSSIDATGVVIDVELWVIR